MRKILMVVVVAVAAALGGAAVQMLRPAPAEAQVERTGWYPAFTTLSSSAPNGVNGFECKTSGCRIDMGPGAGDHFYGAGTGIVFGGYLFTGSDIETSAGSLKGANLNLTSATTLETCTAGVEGKVRRQTGTGGTNTSARTRLCVCTSSGAASPVYAWQNVVTGTVGTTTTCSP